MMCWPLHIIQMPYTINCVQRGYHNEAANLQSISHAHNDKRRHGIQTTIFSLLKNKTYGSDRHKWGPNVCSFVVRSKTLRGLIRHTPSLAMFVCYPGYVAMVDRLGR